MEFGKEFDFIHESITDQKKLYNVLNKIVNKYNEAKDNIKISKVLDEYHINFSGFECSITVAIHLNSHAEVYLSSKYYFMLLVAKMNFKTSGICQKLNSLVLLKKKETERELNDIIDELDSVYDKKTHKTIPEIKIAKTESFFENLIYFL